MKCRFCNLFHFTSQKFYLVTMPHDPPFLHSVLCEVCYQEQLDEGNSLSGTMVAIAKPSYRKP